MRFSFFVKQDFRNSCPGKLPALARAVSRW